MRVLWRGSPQHAHFWVQHSRLMKMKSSRLFTHKDLGPARPGAHSTSLRRYPHLSQFGARDARELAAHVIESSRPSDLDLTSF